MTASSSRRVLLGNFGAHVAGLYGSKALDVLVLTTVTRTFSPEIVGTYFLADAAGGTFFRLLDVGLYPVLQRRAARGELSRGLITSTLAFRVVGVLLLSLVFAVVAHWQWSRHAVLASAFFLLSGVYVLHELPRAVLAGRERFFVTARVGVGMKVLEAAIAVPAVLYLREPVWWLVGRAVSQVGVLVWLVHEARQALPREAAPVPPARQVFREGLPFWFASLFQSAVFRLDALVVGAFVGLAETAHLGIASRIIGGALSLVSSLLVVTYPAMARERRRFITGRAMLVVGSLAAGLGAAVFLGAPLAIRVITGWDDPAPILVVRTMAPVITLATVARALESWLQSKNREKALAVQTVAAGTLASGLLVVLVSSFGTTGAAAARVVRAALDLGSLALITAATLRGVSAPVSWLVQLIPGGKTLLDRALRRSIERTSQALATIPAVRSVDLGGSAQAELRERFRFGVSDLDFTVAIDGLVGAGESLRRAVDEATRTSGLLWRSQALVVDHRVLREARSLGHPVLLTSMGHTLVGAGVTPTVDPVHARSWALTHATTLQLALQRVALEEGRQDGGARAAPLWKQFHFLLRRLGREPSLRLLHADPGAGLPEDALGEAPPRRWWFSPEEVGALLAAGHRLIGEAARDASHGWTPRPPVLQPRSDWLHAAAASCRGRVEALVSLGVRGVQLAGTEVHAAEPALLAVPDGWDARGWAEWVRREGSEPPLAAPFRAAARPWLLPEDVLRADSLLEHAGLVHEGRRRHALLLEGALPAGLAPPDDERRRAARRELVLACLRLPGDVERLARLGGVEELLRPLVRSPADHWRFRARAYLGGRLHALCLMEAGQELPEAEAELPEAQGRLGGPRLPYLGDPPDGTPRAWAHDLEAWWRARVASLET